jgi:hypothetical protein
MAIFNIQEILHPSDSNQIKWEKVNYNFDQILANGGGPTGKKGSPGDQGSVGQTGAKGDQGEIGPQGLTGATTSRWQVIPINANNNPTNEYVILKPKVSTDNYHPVIFLGDQDFNEGSNDNGTTNLRSTLTIGKHAVGGESPSAELVTFWHGQRTGTSNNIAITLSTSEQTKTVDNIVTDWTRFTLAETYGVNLNTDPAEIIEYFVELDKFTFKSSVAFDDITSTFKVPGTSIDVTELEPGMIRYFADTFWGAFEDANGNVSWMEFCTAPCGAGSTPGTVAIAEQPADLNLNQYGGLVGNTVEISPSGDLDVDQNGDLLGIYGCTDSTQKNYDPNATIDDGTCIAYIYGCTDPAALNYYPGADLDDGNCCYIQGCTNANASNYNSEACIDDGSCVGLETIEFTGVTSGEFSNMTHAGGTAYVSYATGPTAGLILSASTVTVPAWVTITSYQNANLDPELTFTVIANTAGARSGAIVITHPSNSGVTDTLSLSQVSDPAYSLGCTDPNGDNYSAEATEDDGSCTYCANFSKASTGATDPTTWGGVDGTFTITATGGSNNYEFSVYFASNDALANPNNLAAGTYYAIITDVGANPYGGVYGCTDRHDFTLSNPTTNATTLAPVPTYNSLIANPGTLNVDEGTTITYTIGTSDVPDGTKVWIDLTGTHNQADILDESSGAGAGSTDSTGWGREVTINNNTGSGSITITNDVILEAGINETIIATLWPTDGSGNATGGISLERRINDTSFPSTATFTGNYSANPACTPASGQGTWGISYNGTQSDFITKMISVNTNQFINYARVESASAGGWGADKILWRFDLNGPTNQHGTNCFPPSLTFASGFSNTDRDVMTINDTYLDVAYTLITDGLTSPAGLDAFTGSSWINGANQTGPISGHNGNTWTGTYRFTKQQSGSGTIAVDVPVTGPYSTTDMWYVNLDFTNTRL